MIYLGKILAGNITFCVVKGPINHSLQLSVLIIERCERVCFIGAFVNTLSNLQYPLAKKKSRKVYFKVKVVPLNF